MIQTRLAHFGNSRGVRIPKPLLEQAGIVDGITMELRDKEIILRRAEENADPRDGWDAAFKAMAESDAAGSTERPMRGANRFDHEEWEW